jgi:hypothetical protein
MRLIKLLAYMLIGYVFYEMYQGMKTAGNRGGASMGGGGRIGSRALRRALNEDSGRMNVTGPGRGTSVATEDTSGASMPHIVGRGVVAT